ncbi:MAG: riboflavin kinase / adenylyltransferase [Chloroflexota bacterium]|nr:riboflavin kinase / adenylyltransferase [Chloroflexota bacterium]
MKTVVGRAQLDPEDGPLLVVVGVFDGLHLGHAYLLEHLVREAGARGARPTVITFDAHPDAILLGHAPPLLMDPAERLERLAAAGVELVVVEHFDDALRQTPYDAFVAGITDRCNLVGIVMTPDAAFGHDRAGTPLTVGELGARTGFVVIVVPPFALDGREVRSSDIRAAIAAGDLAAAERLLGRPYAVTGDVDAAGRVTFTMPVALPPPGTYRATVSGGDQGTLSIESSLVAVSGISPGIGRRIELVSRIGRSAHSLPGPARDHGPTAQP